MQKWCNVVKKVIPYWNHNTVYYSRIKKWTTDCTSILDVGCGDGSLLAYLDDGVKELTGIDIDKSCISRAITDYKTSNTDFICCDFNQFTSSKRYDAIIFVASIHHMDMASAIEKAKTLLSTNGIIIIVGLAKPANVLDYMIEILRILPCGIISKLKHMQSSENLNIPVSYQTPSLADVRKISSEILPHAKIRYGLYYRFLLKWIKQQSI